MGPDGRGVIPEKSVENLLEVGKWLKANGTAIYGSKPWKVAKEGPTNIQIKVPHIGVIVRLHLYSKQTIFGSQVWIIVFT